jgi:hypothetical protein
MIANILYYLIMGYTYIMHYFNKVVSFLKLKQDQQKQDKLECIKNNDCREICKNELVILAPIQFDFIQYTTPDPDNNISIFFTVPTIDNLIIQEPCSYKFISTSIYIPDLDFRNSVEFKGYWVFGNKINCDIIYYLLKLQHNIDALHKKYTLTIIDQDVKIINIDETHLITLDLNNYIIT